MSDLPAGGITSSWAHVARSLREYERCASPGIIYSIIKSAHARPELGPFTWNEGLEKRPSPRQPLAPPGRHISSNWCDIFGRIAITSGTSSNRSRSVSRRAVKDPCGAPTRLIQRLFERPEPGLEISPLIETLLEDGLPYLLRARRADAPLQSCRTPGMPARSRVRKNSRSRRTFPSNHPLTSSCCTRSTLPVALRPMPHEFDVGTVSNGRYPRGRR